MAMEVYQENQLALVVSSPAASPPTSLQELLDAQKQLIGSHIDHLKSIVNRQCKLTGINPLSQEMAAGALSIKIGKRPRDLLNPKAIKYMQLIFSVKDAISKKESREISALFGVTATQVREFFTSQRTRVRRFVRLSRDKAVRSTSSKEAEDGPSCSDSSVPIHPVPLNFVGPTCTEGPSCSTQDEILSCIDDYDKHFVGSIFNMMRTEETFSGQVKLLEWILQTQNSLVLQWFLTKGGVMILASWLGEAASEEQTSVLHVILQVLCHLPLNKAIPAHMSAILQSVNKLRFYQTSDISSRAKILLGRWSKMFARTQAMRKPGSTMSSGDSQDEILLKQSIGEIMGNESWESKIDMDGILIPLSEASVDSRNMGTSQPMKLLMAPTDESNKKLLRGGSSSQTRERRKVQMVEQPGQKGAGRSPQVARSVLATQGRPLSADDIQKAKMRAQFMQHKYGKIITSASNESSLLKIEGSSSYSSSQASNSISASKAFIQPEVDELMKPVKVLPRVVSNQSKATLQNKVTPVSEEPLLKKCKMMQIPWLTPPEFRISTAWSVGTGENSKEVEIQKNRIRREKEIVYKTAQEIPSNPKDPWDQEMDYDDTLTPEVPIDQLPDDSMDTGVSLPLPEKSQEIAVGSNGSVSEPPAQNSNPMKMPEPDLELLAVLLKNPEVVFALTSGQGGNLSGEQMVRLLDMIKSNGVNSVSSLITGIVDKKAEEERVEVSLPSPTPSSNPVTSGWRAEIAKNPFSRGSITVNGEAYTIPRVSVQEMLPASSLAMPQNGLVVAAAHPQQHALYSGAISSPNVQLQQLRPSNATSLSMKNLPVPIPSWPTPLPGDSLLPNHSHHQTQPHAHQTLISEPTYLSSSHSWRGRQGGMAPNAYGQANQSSNTYGVDRVGLMQAPLHSGGWERNEYRGERGFGYNSSGANSPTRYQEHMLEWNYPEPPSRMSSGRSDYRLPPEIARPRNPNGYHERDKNSRWRDRRR